MTSAKVKDTDLIQVHPITKNQQKAFDVWDDGDNLVLAGSAGTGKTFMAMYLALEEVMDKSTGYDKIVLLRSVVPVRDMGFLPGTVEEKKASYEIPYKGICDELFKDPAAYAKLKNNKQTEFETTSFIRGTTFHRTIIIVDEMQNLNFHELDSVMTRVGNHCRIIFCGDYLQSDFTHDNEKDGVMKFLRIVDQLKYFTVVTYGWDDIVRSGLVRDYIMTKEMLGLK